MNPHELETLEQRYLNICNSYEPSKTQRLLKLRQDALIKHNDAPSYLGAMFIRKLSEEVGHGEK